MTKHIYKHIYSFLLAAAFLFGGVGTLFAQEIEWSMPTTDSSGNEIHWRSVTYGNNKFVAVGHDYDIKKGIIMHSFNNKATDSSSKSSSIFGTRFCSAGVTTFCRPQNGFVNNNPLVNIYTELLGLYQQLLSAMQSENS